jgi:hypothetical protein
MRKGEKGSVQSGLLCAKTLHAGRRTITKPRQATAMLRRIRLPNRVVRFVLHRAQYIRPVVVE